MNTDISKRIIYKNYEIETFAQSGQFYAEIRNTNPGTVVHRVQTPQATREAAEGEAMSWIDTIR